MFIFSSVPLNEWELLFFSGWCLFSHDWLNSAAGSQQPGSVTCSYQLRRGLLTVAFGHALACQLAWPAKQGHRRWTRARRGLMESIDGVTYMMSRWSACDYSNLSKWQMASRFSIIVKFSQFQIGVIDAHSALPPKNEFTLYTFIFLTHPLYQQQAFVFCIIFFCIKMYLDLHGRVFVKTLLKQRFKNHICLVHNFHHPTEQLCSHITSQILFM